VLGTVGAATSWFGLRDPRIRSLLLITIAYVPWTVVGLIGDARQGLWPLVTGEGVGLLATVWALSSEMRVIWRRHR